MSESHEPAPPPEPQTPMWLPAVGAALFITVGLWWAVTPKPPKVEEEPPPAASAAPQPAASAPRPAGTPSPAGSALGGGMDNAALQRLLEQLPKK